MSFLYLVLLFVFLNFTFSHAEQRTALFLLKRKGYRLKNSILQSITTEDQMTCAHHCALNKSKCKSFNFIADPTLTGNCELNFGKAQSLDDQNLIPRNGTEYFEKIYKENRENKILATEAPKPTSTPAVAENSPALKLRGDNTVEYGISNSVIMQPAEKIMSISACFWMNAGNSFTSGDEHAILSYAVSGSYNEFLIVLAPKLTLYSGSVYVSTNLDLVDGKNHHVCVTWKFADPNFLTYLDGSHAETTQLTGLRGSIQAGGVWIIGQDQDSFGGGFQNRNSFHGNITEVHVWDRVLTANEINDMASSCVPILKGNLKAYTDFEIKGGVDTYIPKCGLA